MPNGIYPVQKFHRNSDPALSAGLGLRLKAWWQRELLDERLALGADPDTRDELRLRSRQLLSSGVRAELADRFETVVRQARRPVTRTAPSTRLPVRRAEVRECADDLLVLAQRLRADVPIDVRGAAMASRLLMYGTSPLYYQAAPVSLTHAVRSARMTLDPSGTDHAAMAEVA
jgi:hypothetical protein